MLSLELKAEIKVEDLAERVKKVSRLALLKAGQAYVESVKEFVREKEPWKVRTGHLLQSVSYMPADDFKVLVVGESERVKYGRFLEFGTKGPYVIKPRKRKALKIPTEQGYVIGRKAIHPGIKARPWFFRKEHEEKAVKAFEEALKDELSDS